MNGRLLGALIRRLDIKHATSASAPELAEFDPAARGEWAWTQPARFRPLWTLAVDGTAVGTLALRGAFQRTAEASFSNGTWTFRPRFPGDVLVQKPGEEMPLARYRPGWFAGGRIERTGHDTLLWRRERFWRTQWGLFTGDKLPLVHVVPSRAPFRLKREARVELEDAARRLPELSLLLALGWFLSLQSYHSQTGDG